MFHRLEIIEKADFLVIQNKPGKSSGLLLWKNLGKSSISARDYMYEPNE